jgi:Na+-transporting NADH:ubiquinone oxidoreductase subunit A
MRIRIKKGLDIPITGEPEQKIHEGPPIIAVGLLGNEYIGMRPSMCVAEGDHVKLGQVLFTDKQNPGVNFTSPGCGVVTEINRGAKRALQSVAVRLDGDEEERFNAYSRDELSGLSAAQVQENLLASGLWAALRTRPYSKIPRPGTRPNSIFVTAMDSDPLAPEARIIIDENREAFEDGLTVLSKLTDGKLFVCTFADTEIPGRNQDAVRVAEFEGPHPAGLVGTHIHFLDPVSIDKTVWHLGYQDVVAFGKLFTTGRYWVDRVVGLTGSVVQKPRLVRSRLGASTISLLRDELHKTEARVISGSVLGGHRAAGWARFVGRYHNQITVIPEGKTREFMGWIVPGVNKFSAVNVFVSSLFRSRLRLPFNTSNNGSRRAMVPFGVFERIMPLDILPTQLLRSVVVRDTDMAQKLGCLELDEEDLALCTLVCPSKYEYGAALRASLTQIEREG